MRHVLVLFIVALVGNLFFQEWEAYARDEVSTLEVQQVVPSFSLIDQSGNKVNLKDYQGENVVLEWTNPDCPYVKRHYKENTMKNVRNQFKDAEVEWLTINSTHFMSSEDNKKWAEDHKLDWSVLDDHKGLVGKQFKAKTTPHMFIVNAEGKLVYQGAIDDDAHGDKESKERVNYVVKALDDITNDREVAIPSTKSYGCSVKYAG